MGKKLFISKNHLILITLIFISTLFFSSQSIDVISESTNHPYNRIEITAPSASSLEIYNDVDLAAASTSGDGSVGLPYVIEDLNIDTGSLIALLIKDTTKHFVVENCTLSATWGIYIGNVSEGTAHIRNNTVYDCSSYGIYVYQSKGSIVEDNVLLNNQDGINVLRAPETLITNNYCQNINAGIFVRESQGSTVTQNQMYTDGLKVSGNNVTDLTSLDVTDNYVNDLPILYGEYLTSFPAGTYGQVILVNCTNFNIWNLELSNIDEAVALHYCYMVSLYDANIYDVDTCIISYNSLWCWVVDGLFENYSSSGFYAENSNYTTVEGNSYEEGVNAVIFYGVLGGSIRYNTFFNNSYAAVEIENCNSVQIHHNNFIDNGYAIGYQASDINGANTWWYEPVELEGNYWSDLGSADNYTISGTPTKYDLYPLASPYVHIPELSNISFNLLLILALVFSSMLIIPAIRRKN